MSQYFHAIVSFYSLHDLPVAQVRSITVSPCGLRHVALRLSFTRNIPISAAQFSKFFPWVLLLLFLRVIELALKLPPIITAELLCFLNCLIISFGIFSKYALGPFGEKY